MTDRIVDVDELADRFFDGVLQWDPVSATRIGDGRWDDQLPDFADAGRAADAIGVMNERWGAPRSFCEMEVDRYSVWPAQALACKVGQREIERARSEVAERMGDRFDLAVFHDEVLGHGTLPLTIFRREIPVWVEAATRTLTA